MKSTYPPVNVRTHHYSYLGRDVKKKRRDLSSSECQCIEYFELGRELEICQVEEKLYKKVYYNTERQVQIDKFRISFCVNAATRYPFLRFQSFKNVYLKYMWNDRCYTTMEGVLLALCIT